MCTKRPTVAALVDEVIAIKKVPDESINTEIALSKYLPEAKNGEPQRGHLIVAIDAVWADINDRKMFDRRPYCLDSWVQV